MLRALCFLSLAFIGQMFAACSRCSVCLKDSNVCVLGFRGGVSNPRWGTSGWCQGLSTSEPQRRRLWRVLTPFLYQVPWRSTAQHSQPSLLKQDLLGPVKTEFMGTKVLFLLLLRNSAWEYVCVFRNILLWSTLASRIQWRKRVLSLGNCVWKLAGKHFDFKRLSVFQTLPFR